MKSEAIYQIVEDGRVTYTIRRPERGYHIMQRIEANEGKVLNRDGVEQSVVITETDDVWQEREKQEDEGGWRILGRKAWIR